MNSTSFQNTQDLPPNEIAIDLREIAEKIESRKKNTKSF